MRGVRGQGEVDLRAEVREWVESLTDRRLQIWARLRLAAERAVDLAEEFGYRDGSGVLRVAQRLKQRSLEDKSLARKLAGIRKRINLASVKS